MNQNIRERFAELPDFLSNHLMLTVIALVVGVLISVPLAVFLTRRKRLQYPMLTAAGVIQTIPSLALLALMVPLLDKTRGFGLGLDAFGFYPATIALTMYSILPILRNTVTGITGVDPAMIEAARGVGMTERQVLFKVQLPLAAPVIIAGIRTATVWIVGIATLATPVGQKCLGNYIFTGLQTRNWTMVLFGVVAAAVLAILLDLLIGGAQKAVEQHRRVLGVTCSAAMVVIIVGGLASPPIVRELTARDISAAPEATDATGDAAALTRVRINRPATPAERVIAGTIRSELDRAGIDVTAVDAPASENVIKPLHDGDVDLLLDFNAAAWKQWGASDDASPRWIDRDRFIGWLAEEHDIRVLGIVGSVDGTQPYDLAVLAGSRAAGSSAVAQALKPALRRWADAASAGDAAGATVPQRAVRVGAKTFTEQYILAALITQQLERHGCRAQRTESLGSTIVFEALANGDLDVYVDYSGTIWANAMKRTETAAPWKVLALMDAWLAESRGIRSLGPLGFENAYALAMRREQAERLGIKTISDLAEHAPNMSIGGDYEFFGRPEWVDIRDSYGLNFNEQTSFDSSIMYQAVNEGQVDVISAFSSDGRIESFDLLVLEDDRQVIPPYDAILMVGPALADNRAVVEALRPLVGAIDVSLMREANHRVDRSENPMTAAQAAQWLMQQIRTGPTEVDAAQ